MTNQAQEIIGKIGFHKRHPERFALMFPNGEASNFFPRGVTRAEVVADLAQHGMVVQADDSVVRV